MTLTPDQQKVANAFMNFLQDKTQSEMVIEGFPGCGKSFLTKYLIDAIRAQNQLIQLISPGQSEITIYCTATTNKAAAVLANLSGQEASTIHSLLGLKVTNNYTNGTTSLRRTGRGEIIRDSIIFVDEASYTNTQLLQFIRNGTIDCKIVYIGDRYQLATVGETECPVFTTISNKGVLTGSQRFSGQGSVAALAAQYRAWIDGGSAPQIIPDNKEIFHHSGLEFQNKINQEFTGLSMVQDKAKVLAWSNNKVRDYNDYIRRLHTPDVAFTVGERVVTNQPILFGNPNSSMTLPTESVGKVTSITEGEEHGVEGWWIVLNNTIRAFQPRSHMQVQQWLKLLAKESKENKSWDKYFEVKDFFADLRPVYSSTVYKAQGSTYQKVFIDLTDIGKCTQAMTVARMMHVAVTRTSGEVHLYGQLPARYGGVI